MVPLNSEMVIVFEKAKQNSELAATQKIVWCVWVRFNYVTVILQDVVKHPNNPVLNFVQKYFLDNGTIRQKI